MKTITKKDLLREIAKGIKDEKEGAEYYKKLSLMFVDYYFNADSNTDLSFVKEIEDALDSILEDEVRHRKLLEEIKIKLVS
jgi:DNA topoisomerase IA